MPQEINAAAKRFQDLRIQVQSSLQPLDGRKDDKRSCSQRAASIFKQALATRHSARIQDRLQRLILSFVCPQKVFPKRKLAAPSDEQIVDMVMKRLALWHDFRCVDKKQKIGVEDVGSPRQQTGPISPHIAVTDDTLSTLSTGEDPRPQANTRSTLLEHARIVTNRKSMGQSISAPVLENLSGSFWMPRKPKKEKKPKGDHVLDVFLETHTKFHAIQKRLSEPPKVFTPSASRMLDKVHYSRQKVLPSKLPPLPGKRVWFDNEERKCDSQVLKFPSLKNEPKAEVSLWDLCRGDTQGFTCFQDEERVVKDTPKEEMTPSPPFTVLDIKANSVPAPDKYAAESYFDMCLKQKSYPKLRDYLFDNVPEVALSDLSTPQLEAVSVSLVTAPPMESIELICSPACTDTAFERFLQQVLGDNARRASRLVTLDLSDNKNFSTLAITKLSYLLKEDLSSLEKLTLNNAHFTESTFSTFCGCLREQGQVRHLGLASTRAGLLHNSASHLAILLGNMSSLEKVNLGYNSFNETGFKTLGKALLNSWPAVSGLIWKFRRGSVDVQDFFPLPSDTTAP